MECPSCKRENSREGGLGLIGPWAYLGLERVLTLNPELSERAGAEEALDSAFGEARESRMRVCEPMVEEARAALAPSHAESDSARAAPTRAHTLYAEMGASGHAARLASELGL